MKISIYYFDVIIRGLIERIEEMMNGTRDDGNDNTSYIKESFKLLSKLVLPASKEN